MHNSLLMFANMKMKKINKKKKKTGELWSTARFKRDLNWAVENYSKK